MVFLVALLIVVMAALLAMVGLSLARVGGLKEAYKLIPKKTVMGEEIVADLDRLITEPVWFKWDGKAHMLKPMTFQTFLEVTQIYAEMDALKKSPDITSDALLDIYTRLFKKVCTTINDADVRKMSHSQIAALFQLIFDSTLAKAALPEKDEVIDKAGVKKKLVALKG